MTSPLRSQAQQLERWISDAALPFWAQNAVDARGGWYEHLDLDGAPNVDVVRRLRVQARQIYVYALAEKRGWYPGREIAENTFEFMRAHGYRKNNAPGFIHLLNSDYSVNNPRRDLYDHAFYLLSCAWAHDVKIIDNPFRLADEIMAFVDDELSVENQGWSEGIPAKLPRRQNPHMHLLEAFMGWHDVCGDPRWMTYANQVFTLFERHFFDAEHHIICEFFTQDWTLAAGDAGQTVEPGHGAEWIWLLWMFEKRSGIDTSAYAARLYDKILRGADVFLNDEEDISGRVRRGTKRLWVQTELIKAHLAQAERGVSGASDMAAAAIDGFMQVYLRPNGTWVDQIDLEGQPIATTIPTSTFYHIACMISETCRVSDILSA